MASGASSVATKYLTTLFQSGTAAGLSDRELLERFAARLGEHDVNSELAFTTLVARHGVMVLQVCRAVLGDRHDAEDAFQATFLILATRAGSIRRGASVGSWLHGAALRVSACARSRAARRRRHEGRRAEMMKRSSEGDIGNPAFDDDLGRIIQEEIGRLPDRFRAAVVLCYLEGLTHEMAAEQSGCPVGTIRSRLATAREQLRKRLTRRGLAPAVVAMALSGSGVVSASESAVLSLSIPAALADATVRGALRVGLGKSALAGVVSTEATMLLGEGLKTMMTTKMKLLTSAALVGGLAAAGLGVATYSTPGRGNRRAIDSIPDQKSAARPDANLTPGKPALPRAAQGEPSADEWKQMALRDSQQNVDDLLRDAELAVKAFWKEAGVAEMANSTDARRAFGVKHRRILASYAGALLNEAELNPATPPAQDALIWIVKNVPFGSMFERAKEMIARDHIRSPEIEPLLTWRLSLYGASTATERLLREALARNPDRKIQGLACFYLARYFDFRASRVRRDSLYDPAELERERPAYAELRAGQDDPDRLDKLNPEALEREAASLYERVIKDFGDIPSPEPPLNQTNAPSSPARSTTLLEPAAIWLKELRLLGIGRPAPEIEGTDLDGKPMKLSEYRGKVVVLYFGGPVLPSDDKDNRAAAVTNAVQKVAERHANEPFALLGVATISPGPSAGREAYKVGLKARGLPARFWWDLEQFGTPGPIQTAWNVRDQIDLFILDHNGVIRYKHVLPLPPNFLEKAVTALLREAADDKARPKKSD